MRLTNTLRDAFVRAVMNDVPQVDYHEKTQKLADKYLDEKFAEVFGDKLTRQQAAESGWVEESSIYTPGCLPNVYGPCPGYHCLEGSPIWAELRQFAEAHEAQSDALGALEAKLRAVALSVATTEALAKLLPEFEKYLPASDPKAQMLPAVANIVADFVKAGWPKSEQKEEAAA